MTALGIDVSTRDNDYTPWTALYQARKRSPEEIAYIEAREESVEMWRKHNLMIDEWETMENGQELIDQDALRCEVADRRRRELYLEWMKTYKES
jgi:hypothetical protein